MNDRYEVLVGNIGTVYSGNDYIEALNCYSLYEERRLESSSRCYNESILLFVNGEIEKEINC